MLNNYTYQIISPPCTFLFLDDFGLLLLLGLFDGTALVACSSLRHESLKLIRVVIGILSCLMSLSFRIAWMACCTFAEGTPS